MQMLTTADPPNVLLLERSEDFRLPPQQAFEKVRFFLILLKN